MANKCVSTSISTKIAIIQLDGRPGRCGVVLVTELGQVPPGDQPDPGGEALHQQSHHGGDHEHPQQPELGPRARGEVRLDVARVQVRDGHEEAGAREGPQLPETEPGREGSIF